MTIQHQIIAGEIFHGRVIHELQVRCKHKCTSKCMIKSRIHTFYWHVQNVLIHCRSQELLPFFSVIYLSLQPIPPSSLPSPLTSSYHMILGLPLSLVVFKFIYNTFWEFYFLPFSLHAQTKVIYLSIA